MKQYKRLFPLAAFAAMALTACAVETESSETSQDLGESQDPINGGSATKGEPAVGVVSVRDNAGNIESCTATLISSTVVLTAAHCFDGGYHPVSFYTGSGVPLLYNDKTLFENSLRTMTAHQVDGFDIAPTYRPAAEQQCPNPTPDVALVHLAAPITDIQPMPYASHAPVANTLCRTVGFGLHDRGDGTKDVLAKRVAGVRISRVGPSSLEQRDFSRGVPDHGDSGGPLICGKVVVGDTSCRADGQPEHYARVDTSAPWIRATMEKWAAEVAKNNPNGNNGSGTLSLAAEQRNNACIPRSNAGAQGPGSACASADDCIQVCCACGNSQDERWSARVCENGKCAGANRTCQTTRFDLLFCR